MARSSSYYPLYYVFGSVQLSTKVIALNTKRTFGLDESKTEYSYYEKIFWLKNLLKAIEPSRVGNLTPVQVDDIIDQIVELCAPELPVNFNICPAIYTLSMGANNSNTASLLNFSVAFTGLTDTFASYAGKGLKYVRVRSAESGLEVANIQASEVAFTPTGTISSTNTQAAVAEVSGDVTAVTADVAQLLQWESYIDGIAGNGVVVKIANSPTINRYALRIIAAGSTNIVMANGNGVGGNPTIDVSMTPTFTTVTTTGNLTVIGNIVMPTLGATVDGVDISDADFNNLKRIGTGTPSNQMWQDLDMNNTFFIRNLIDGSSASDGVNFGQVVRTTSNQTGLTGIKGWDDYHVFQNSIIKNNIPVGMTVDIDSDEQMIVGGGYSINGILVNNGVVIYV